MTNPAVPRLEDALDGTTLEILKNGSWGGGAPVTQETLDNLSDCQPHETWSGIEMNWKAVRIVVLLTSGIGLVNALAAC